MTGFSKRFYAATREFTTIARNIPAPYLRRSFTLDAPADAASLTVCGLGFYELFVNGQKITKGHMAPYISNPDDILYYDSYDIAPYLRTGENVIGFLLGNGMLNCWGGFVWDFEKAVYRSAPKVAFRAEIRCGEDVRAFEADERMVCHPSPILSDDLRIGEEYDARLALTGWAEPGFDAAGWTPALPAETPRGEARLCEAEPIVRFGERRPAAILPQDNAYIYDFGVNDAGITRLHIHGKPGQKITLYHGEALVDGRFYADNLIFLRPEYAEMPQYTQRIVYTCRGGDETFEPSFTYHGFRYVLVEGIEPEQATEELLTYVVMHTKLKERGSFSCSDETANTIQRMTRTSTESNFYYFPTDCPHREKNGWTADASLSAEQALLNLSVENSYREWLRNICKAMDDQGALPGIVPTSGWGFAWGNGPAWDHVLVNLPYYIYVLRGDLSAARECAPAFLRYVRYITTRTRPDGLIAIGLGDWCATHGTPKSPLEFTDSVMCYDIATKASVLFDAMGMVPERDFCKTVAEGFRTAVRTHLVDFSNMVVAGNCQTSQAMAIYYGILTPAESAQAFRVLVDMIHAQDDHFDVGVLGARVLFDVLSRGGEADLAYRLITRETFPSYATWIQQGNTALGEAFSQDKKPYGSLNHHFWGDVSGWFIRAVGGIRLNPTGRNVHEVTFAPKFIGALSHAEAKHQAPDGALSCAWKRDGADVLLTVSFPEGMTARVELPQGWQLKEGLWKLESGAELRCVRG